ncbi:MAG: hypothetical protein EA427_16975 [Spirochaetaceae bacterium]|nr:MAG: hypothetical protein EA427_16975 [Spirochaetaceae bacterium]
MRAAVLFFGGPRREKVAELARGLAEGLERGGHQVDLIDGDHDIGRKLTVYEYIALGTAATTLFGGKLDPKIEQYLSQAGTLLGKKSFAFVLRTTMGSHKGLANLMKVMEKQGLFLRFSEIIRSREEAVQVARRLKLDR